jgi:GWxTD domain-containing protein
MKKIFLEALFILCGLFFINKVLPGVENLSFDYDYCLFKLEDGRLYLELYYSFYQNELRFVKTDGGYEAAGKLDIQVFDTKLEESIINKDFKVPVLVSDTLGYDRNTNLTGQVNFLLDSGLYEVKILAADFYNPVRSSVISHNLSLNRFVENKVCFSGVQIANKIQKSSDTKSVFYKNTLEVVPNPSRLFGNNLSTLFYYFELYNLNKNNLTEDYSLISSITDLNNVVIISKEKECKILSESKAEFGSFDVGNLKTNPYYLELKVLDRDNNEIAKAERKFFIFNSDSSITDYGRYKDDYLLSEYAKYTGEQADEEFRYAIYVATDKEKTEYGSIKNLEGKRKFLYEFWKRKDPASKGPINKFKKEYLRRISYSNTNFTSNFREGWKSDKGRVYCIYGKPDEVERFPFQPDVRSYEIWNYNSIEGGVIFVFIDLSNSAGDYALVHSTAKNEISDENWKDKLSIK